MKLLLVLSAIISSVLSYGCPNVEGYKKFKLNKLYGTWQNVANIPFPFIEKHECVKVTYAKKSRKGSDVFFSLTNSWENSDGSTKTDPHPAYYSIKNKGWLQFSKEV